MLRPTDLEAKIRCPECRCEVSQLMVPESLKLRCPECFATIFPTNLVCERCRREWKLVEVNRNGPEGR